MQHARRVCRIADQDQIRLRRYLVRVEPEAGSGGQDQPVRLVAGRRSAASGSVNCGWMISGPLGRRVRASRVKASGTACGGQDLINGDAVTQRWPWFAASASG